MATTNARPFRLMASARRARPWLALRGWALIATVSVGACNSVWGMDHLRYDRDDGKGGTTPAGGTTGSAGASAEGGATTSSTSTQAGAGGAAAVENCLDGQDNNNNGLTDCDDPACSGYSCVPVAGPVISVVALSSGPCQAPATTVSWLGCTACSCAATAGQCWMTLKSYLSSSCLSIHNQANTPGCRDTDPVAARWFTAEVSGPWQTACVTTDANQPATALTACELPTWGQCANGDACVPTELAQGKACVRVDSAADCPDAHPNRYMVQPTDVGGATCSCSCEMVDEDCEPPTVDIFASSTDCTGTPTTIDLTNECTSAGLVTSFDAPAVHGVVTCAATGELEEPVNPAVVCCAG